MSCSPARAELTQPCHTNQGQLQPGLLLELQGSAAGLQLLRVLLWPCPLLHSEVMHSITASCEVVSDFQRINFHHLNEKKGEEMPHSLSPPPKRIFF